MGFLRGVSAVLLGLAVSFQAGAQGYPNKPVRLIISFTPGSSTGAVDGPEPYVLGVPVVEEGRWFASVEVNAAAGSAGSN